VLKGIPKFPSGKYIYGALCSNGGFYGRISSTKYYNYSITMKEVDNIYAAGPHAINRKLKKSDEDDDNKEDDGDYEDDDDNDDNDD